MIRRAVGSELWLFTQHDHAQLAGELAQRFGNARFARPEPREATVRGIALHDCGWPLHDDAPTLNQQHLPLDVFETPRHIGLEVWSASAQRAAAADPYAGLLVSLHSLALSVFATTQTPFTHEKFDAVDPRARFDINKFQHAQIELQETLRRRIGLSVDQPLTQGLAEDSRDAREQQLVMNFRLLQAMDKLSLNICCTQPLFPKIEPLIAQPGARPMKLHVTRPSAHELRIRPWPFDRDELPVEIPYRILAHRAYTDETELRAVYDAAPTATLRCTVRHD
jgi:hypothetical protein